MSAGTQATWPEWRQQLDDLHTELRRAQAIIDGLKLWRERILTTQHESTPLMRDRIRELATERDDFDRAVLLLLNDFDATKRVIAEPLPPPPVSP